MGDFPQPILIPMTLGGLAVALMSDGVRWASRSSTGTVRIRMHNKLAALVALGKYGD